MEVAKLILEIVICLLLAVVGGSLVGTVVWLTLLLRSVAEQLRELDILFEDVIDSAKLTAAQSGVMALAVGEFKKQASDDQKALRECTGALLRIVAKNVVMIESLGNVVTKFSADLLAAAPGEKRKNYDVSPEVSGITKEQQEQREAAEILKVWGNSAPEVISTEG